MKSDAAWRGGVVLAAVQVAPEDEAHEDVRTAVVKSAREIATQLGFELQIVTVDPQRAGWFDRAAFAARCQVPHQHLHVKRGNAITAISELVTELAADLLVLGTVAREDAKAGRVGNTAEKLAVHGARPTCWQCRRRVAPTPPRSDAAATRRRVRAAGGEN